MTIHKLFKELIKLSDDDRELLFDAIREQRQVKQNCKLLDVKYSDKKLLSWLKKTSHYRLTKAVATAPMNQPISTQPDPTLEKLKQIVLGTNLDQIEEAAEKKGLL